MQPGIIDIVMLIKVISKAAVNIIGDLMRKDIVKSQPVIIHEIDAM